MTAGPTAAMRVVLVDDNANIRRLLRELLEVQAACTVIAEVDDGDGAAKAVADAEPDLAIVDYHMARVDGVEATRRIKAARPGVEVVAFTSADDESVVAAFLAAGASRHFDKAAIDDLVAHVRSRASSARRSPG